MSFSRALVPLIVLMLGLAPSGAEDPPAGDGPLDLDVFEETGSRLVQIDVSFRAKKKKGGSETGEIPELSPEDFELVIGGNRMPLSYADRICRAVEAEPPPAEVAAAEPTAPAEPPPVPAAALRGTYVFYLEHTLLTIPGQATALAMVKQLIPELVTGGARGMVVSSGNRLIQSPLTDDVDALLEVVELAETDKGQWTSMTYAASEDERITEILRVKDRGEESRAANMARRHQMQEAKITANRLSRLRGIVSALADLDPPKAVLYFSDLTRQEPGRHYAEYIGGGGSTPGTVASFIEISGAAGAAAFDRVTHEAGSHGVRLYTIQARGLFNESSGASGRASTRGALPRRRHDAARNTMESFALETGGESFLGGSENANVERIVGKIHDDLRCFYLLSFRPEDLGRDRKLPLRVRFNQDSPRFDELESAYDIRTRGQIVIQSESKRKESVLFAAHVSEGTVETDSTVNALIPLGWEDGEYQALVQLRVDNPDLPKELSQSVAWDLGMTHEFKEEIGNKVSRRVQVGDPAVPIVLETVWKLKPGRHKIQSVAYENRFGQIATGEIEEEWPEPAGDPVISPIAVVQPADGVFVRMSGDTEETRPTGPLGIGDGVARVDRQTALISLVCRPKRMRGPLWIERKLIGNSEVEFPMRHWDGGDEERCTPVVDGIAQGLLGWGDFRYRIRVHAREDLSDEALTERTRDFVVWDATVTAEDLGGDTAPSEGPRRVDPLGLATGSD